MLTLTQATRTITAHPHHDDQTAHALITDFRQALADSHMPRARSIAQALHAHLRQALPSTDPNADQAATDRTIALLGTTTPAQYRAAFKTLPR